MKRLLFVAALLMVATFLFQSHAQKQSTTFSPTIPKTWVDAEMAELEVPLVDAASSPKQVSADYYYRMRVRPIYKSYPLYAPGKEPPGYLDWLKQQEPEIVFDATKLKTEADWIKAGELVFDAPLGTWPMTANTSVRTTLYYEKTATPLTKEGINPFDQYVIREKGKVEIGTGGCTSCHTRVMPDGTVLKGAQGNPAFDRVVAFGMERSNDVKGARNAQHDLFATPWIKPDPLADVAQLTLADIAGRHYAIPLGVLARHGTSSVYPVQIPDLIGVKERKYLDRTGLQLHRSAVDMMRYAALNQGAPAMNRANAEDRAVRSHSGPKAGVSRNASKSAA